MPTLQTFIELSRVDRFAGTMILFWPYSWSLTMSARQYGVSFHDYFQALAAGFLGACLLHRYYVKPTAGIHVLYDLEIGGGCVWNDIIDKDLDAQVERTKHRPLPDGRITVSEAMVFLSLHVMMLFVLSYNLNTVAWMLAFLTVIPLTGLYPFMKRITYWPQAWLGITLNVPVLLASAVLINKVSTASAVMAFGGWAWTMWYDTIYACQDKRDDAKAGVKSIVLLLRQHVKTALSIFASVLVLSWFICGILSGNGIPYFLVSVVGGGSILARDLLTVDLDDSKSCLVAFQNNGFVIGPLVWAGLLLDYMIHSYLPSLGAVLQI